MPAAELSGVGSGVTGEDGPIGGLGLACGPPYPLPAWTEIAPDVVFRAPPRALRKAKTTPMRPMATSASTSAYSTSPWPASHLRNNRKSRTTIRPGAVTHRERGGAGAVISCGPARDVGLLQSFDRAPEMQGDLPPRRELRRWRGLAYMARQKWHPGSLQTHRSGRDRCGSPRDANRTDP